MRLSLYSPLLALKQLKDSPETRDPSRLREKLNGMKENPFAFFSSKNTRPLNGWGENGMRGNFVPKNIQNHSESLPQPLTPSHGLNLHPRCGLPRSTPTSSSPHPKSLRCPQKCSPDLEKQLTSVAGVTQRHTPSPTGATIARLPRRRTKRAELGARLRPNPRAAVPAGTAGRSPPVAAGELGSRRLPDKLPF